MSQPLYYIIAEMLEKNPARRASIERIIQHPVLRALRRMSDRAADGEAGEAWPRGAINPEPDGFLEVLLEDARRLHEESQRAVDLGRRVLEEEEEGMDLDS